MNPNGLIDLRGYGAAMPYFKELSEKTGIDFEVYHAGKYKSAVEPFYRSEISDENRFQTRVFLNSFHEALVNHISSTRQISEDQVDNIITYARAGDANACLNLGLIDETLYESDFEERMKERYGWKKFKTVNTADYQSVIDGIGSSASSTIAVIIAEGDVGGIQSDKGSIGMNRYDKVFDRIEKNENIQGVVLRVNSPGGSVWTSDNFLARVKKLQSQGKYVVASFGNYAASGGYYIAASADQIVSEPTSLTGSIGAFSMIPNFYQASKQMLGINWDTISTGRHTFLYSSFAPKSKAERNILQAQTDLVYDQFKNVVAEGRSWNIDDVEKIAQGRVWTGDDAYQIGLVDTIGNLQDAINLVAHAQDMTEYDLEFYPKIKKTFWETMIGSLTNNIQARIERPQAGLNNLLNDLNQSVLLLQKASEAPQMRLPVQVLTH